MNSIVCQKGSPRKGSHESETIGRTLARGVLCSLAALMALNAAPAQAGVTTTTSLLQGWVNSRGGSDEAAPLNNTFTGNENGMRYNSWVMFHIPAGTYTSASLSITPAAYGAPGACVIGLYDVTTPGSALANTFSPGKSVFDDLGSGRQYAAATLSAGQPITIPLNGRALADINAVADRYFVIGFTNMTLNAQPAGNDGHGVYINGIGRSMTLMQLNLGTPDGSKSIRADAPAPATWLQ
jgi:hypothetical protein